MRKIFLIAVIALVIFIGFEIVTFPNVAPLAKETPKSTAFMDQRREELRREGKDDTLQYRPVSYGKISPYLRRAALVAEDNSFYEHQGVDIDGMKEALRKDWERKKITRGGSTITQQLAKNLYLSPSRNPFRKVEEYFIARSLEEHLTKKRILELYLNVVEMGERVYGAEAAARHYFNKSASALTPSEAALLAGCLPNPRAMDPGSPNKRLRWRQKMILSRLRRWGYLAEEEVLTEKKPQTTEPPAVDTALQQTPPTDTATPATPPTDTSATMEPATPQSPQTPTDSTSTTETTTTVPPPP